MDRSTTPYLLLHYLLLIGLILLTVDLVERTGTAVPLWLGVLIAIGVGVLYPRAVTALGVAPEGWE
ncbi:hypothetical protein GRS48_12265 [Halorubrum sp. JWXQ-INN 858]|uniref:hypothetical protein n=1 Tax=Halorubrum sp. JWXQ-INN 858 TaxID=2690782 RepID=UPI001359EA8D|nr:hypothetical protein [Halorubrum sp. JWXQ-INN 858]MWV65588.1 hypothetical protein [Halorubrum sp. JWXQ-INN 858]